MEVFGAILGIVAVLILVTAGIVVFLRGKGQLPKKPQEPEQQSRPSFTTGPYGRADHIKDDLTKRPRTGASSADRSDDYGYAQRVPYGVDPAILAMYAVADMETGRTDSNGPDQSDSSPSSSSGSSYSSDGGSDSGSSSGGSDGGGGGGGE
jgi:uncharacterized membrane protein YgcG